MECEVFRTAEEEFRASLKSWGEDDNRPFIRVKENKRQDKIHYELKHKRILEEKLGISRLTGDSLDNINLIDAFGDMYSRTGNIKDFSGGF
ncbi:hypothetical protein CPT_Stills27 [Bacillus phage Stills]|uniref:Uncharacterized protein n=1 Tax=Bacillus phage Stills TaxID=1610833 RepID=A0A0E3T7K6_9CAUD|nr:hypothetical protein CPT_Stills27 [Bacillus phage Stills]AKC02655.1 hypothetical protein CPT_Stills27 [Bacillus phage Stills]